MEIEYVGCPSLTYPFNNNYITGMEELVVLCSLLYLAGLH